MTQGLLGFRAQSMSGQSQRSTQLPHIIKVDRITTTSSGTLTAPCTGVALIYAIGEGGTGAYQSGGTGEGGGGGGGALYKRIAVIIGQPLGYSVTATLSATNTNPGRDGGDTTVTLPGGFVIRAGGGKGGNGPAGGAGGVSTGGDLNRTGGAGGTASGAVATAGTNGGLPGTGVGVNSAGGGAAGFTDMGTLPIVGGAGSDGAIDPSSSPAASSAGGGSGGCASSASAAGAAGRGELWVVWVQQD